MRKLITVILAMAMLMLPAGVLADEGLGMTIGTFLDKYNAIPAPLGSPYCPLKESTLFSESGAFNIVTFYPVNDPDICLRLATTQPMNESNMRTCQLSAITLYSPNADDLIALIGIAARCAEPFGYDIMGVNSAPLSIGTLIRYYYENDISEGDSATVTLNADNNITMLFSHSLVYAFQILNMKEFQQ